MKSNNVLISVIMCFYNTPNIFLEEAIDSILKQSFKEFEFIIINDGSTEEPSYDFKKDKRILYVKNNVNKGISYSRNVGLSLSKGKYIAIMDSDDIALPTRLEKQYHFMESNKDIVVCGSWFEQFGYKNNICKRIIDSRELYRCSLLFGNEPTILDPSSMLRKSAIEKINFKYNENMKVAMDYFAWVLFSEIGIVTNYNEVLMKYRLHNSQITNTHRGKSTKDGWLVKEYQLQKIGTSINESIKDMLTKPLSDTRHSMMEYYEMLRRLSSSNLLSHYFDQEEFEKVLKKQWYKKILYSKKVGYLFKGLKEIKGQRLTIIKIVLRHFNIFLKDKSRI